MMKIMKLLGLLIVAVGGSLSAAGTVAQAQEAYPPSTVVILITPPSCDATTITGVVQFVEPGSQVTVTLNAAASGWKALAPIDSTTVTADASGVASFTLTVPAATYGTFTVSATGTGVKGDPVSVSGTVKLIECKPLPDTGSNSTGMFLSIGAVALMAGSTLVVGAMRRRRTVAQPA